MENLPTAFLAKCRLCERSEAIQGSITNLSVYLYNPGLPRRKLLAETNVS